MYTHSAPALRTSWSRRLAAVGLDSFRHADCKSVPPVAWAVNEDQVRQATEEKLGLRILLGFRAYPQQARTSVSPPAFEVSPTR